MTRERFHAVFLAAIMLLSVVAMGAGFAGSAAANHADSDVIVVDDDFSETNETHKNSLEAAVSAAAAGDTVRVRNGTYERFTRVQKDDLTITAAEGADPQISVSSAENLPDSGRIIDIGGSNVRFSGIDIEGPERGTGVGVHLGIADGSSAIAVSDVEITNVLTGIQTSTTTNAQIKNNDISTASVGISIQADSATVTKNNISDIAGAPAEGIGIIGTDHTIKQNNIDVGEDVVGVRFYNNDVPAINANSGDEVSVANTVLSSNDLRSVEFTRSGSVYDGSITIGANSYPSIEAAIDAAPEDSTISVQSGVYQNFTIDKNVNLVGVDNPVIEASQVKITANGASLSGFSFTGNYSTWRGDDRVRPAHVKSPSSSVFYPIVWIDADNVTVSDVNVSISDSSNWTGAVTGAVVSGDSELSGSTFTAPNDYENKGQPIAEIIAGSNVSLTDNEFSRNIGGYVGENQRVTVENNEFTGEKQNLGFTGPGFGAIPDSAEITVTGNNLPIKVNTDQHVNQWYFASTSIQPGVDNLGQGNTLEVGSATYNENVTISTPNVTLQGEGDPIINGRIDIKSDEVTIQDITVRNGAPSGSDEVEGIFVGNSAGFDDRDGKVTIQNVTVENIHPHGTSKTLEGIHVKHYDDGENIDGVEIVDVTVRNVTGPSDAGANGVKLQAGISNISVTDSAIDDVEGGWAYGVTSTWSGGESGAPADVVTTETTISNISGVGFHVAADDGSNFADPTEITVERNSFIDNRFDIYNANKSATLRAPFNYYGDDTDPLVGGNVIYDPFLTSAPDQVDADPVSETTDFGHDLVIPANGKPHSVAFPAPVEGNVSEVFGDFNGTVYAYDGDEWESGEEIADKDVDALDAFVVTVDEDERFLQVEFEYAETDDPVPSMTTTDLEAGWNFVGAPTGYTDSDEAFAGSTAEVTTVIDVFAGQNTVSTPYGLDASGEVSNPGEVSPFKGYWVFVTDDGELGATVPVEPTQETEEGALTGN